MAVCEAFIMTGQKILKLSSDESGPNKIKQLQENNNLNLKSNLNYINTEDHHHHHQDIQQDPTTVNGTNLHDNNIDEDKNLGSEGEEQDKVSSTDEGLVTSSNENIDDCKSSIFCPKALKTTNGSQVEEGDEDLIEREENCNGSSKDSGIEDKKLEQQQTNIKVLEESGINPTKLRNSELKSHDCETKSDQVAMSQHTRSHVHKHSSKKDDNKTDTIITFKAGYLNRKRTFESGGKPTARGRRSWRRVYVILQDLRIKMRNGIHKDDILDETMDNNNELNDHLKVKKELDPDDRPIITNSTSNDNNKKPPKSVKTKQGSTLGFDIKSTSKIHHCLASPSTTYDKREYVFHLKLADKSEFLLQANNKESMLAWIESINFAAACLSAPALPDAIVNSNNETSSPKSKAQINISQIINRRPILPTSYTKLSYWDQLLDHEERLQALKRSLQEHLAQVPNTRNKNKRFEKQLIDKIANLREDIERYGIYVDLMQKKSNSPEAMILSKHAKIVTSLTPSKEMMMYVPLK